MLQTSVVYPPMGSRPRKGRRPHCVRSYKKQHGKHVIYHHHSVYLAHLCNIKNQNGSDHVVPLFLRDQDTPPFQISLTKHFAENTPRWLMPNRNGAGKIHNFQLISQYISERRQGSDTITNMYSFSVSSDRETLVISEKKWKMVYCI